MAINEVLQRWRHAAPFKAEATQDFLRDGVRNILGSISRRIEHDHTQRIAVLAADQIGDGGLIVGAVEVGLRERGAEPAIVIDDDIIIFRCSRNNRGPFTQDGARFRTRIFGMEDLPLTARASGASALEGG